MAGTQTKTALTGDDLLALPTGMGQRYELIEGELVTMTPAGYRHGVVALQIGFLLKNYNAQHKLGTLCGAETGFYTRGDDKTVRAPDLAFTAYTKLPAGPLPDGFLRTAPDLVVEVVSPSDRASEIEQKTQEWLDFGVPLVWVVYPETQHVHVYAGRHDQPRILTADDAINGGGILPGFEAPVRAFFQD
jgi:Uma2 family endonuclease